MKAYKKALFIYNPLSGNRDIATELDKIVGHFIKNKIILTVIRLEEEVYDMLSDLLKNLDYDFIIGVGGDGTIDSIARRIVKNNVKKPYALLGS